MCSRETAGGGNPEVNLDLTRHHETRQKLSGPIISDEEAVEGQM